MAFGDVWNGIKKKVEDMLYNGEAEPARQPRQQAAQPRQEDMGAPAPDMGFTQQGPAPQYGYYQEMPQQPYQQQPYQQQPYAPQQGYQMPPQQPQQAPQPQQPQYHANYQQQGYQPPQQPQQGGRFSRFGAKGDNVVDIGDYQQKNGENAPQQAMENAPQQAPVATRVICTRGMADCRMAITLLRSGDAVLVTMENVKDPAEMRRLVDTLSGACYSLNASITKVSRFGVYLLAPHTMPVFADQMINQMNGARPQQAAPAYQPQPRPQYQPLGYEQQPRQAAYDPQPQNAWQPPQQQRQQDGFTQRTAAPQENPGAFYARPQQSQPVQMPSFSSQSANAGYVPDDMEAAE